MQTNVTNRSIPMPRLERGDKNESVRSLQKLLNAYRYAIYDPQNKFSPLETDGDFGPATEEVVRKFQREYRLAQNLSPIEFPADGIVGTLTWRALGDFANLRCC
ncbi:MAG: peptidoglycan-binding domain-containing protein [Mastigocoleus sp. MO_167.B18]|nr:peptidoglycan-binding domain-containing protein [Mastigocoleus sp. MO_167.B18]